MSSYIRYCLVLCALILASAAAFPAQTPKVPTQIPGRDAIFIGDAWYPEQWPESRWEEDLRLMEAANIRMVRIAEFAWSRMEPSEGHYDFEWLDRAIALAAKHNIVVVLGTPTATPPAWLTQKYPDVLRVEENGERAIHGMRAHGSGSSPRYRELCRKITEQMALRYGHNPHVAGWQIDNEQGYAQMSYDEETRRQFQEYLQDKFKTLEDLNTHWTTAYWSQTYDTWQEIPIPVPLESHNPGLALEWKRFTTKTWFDYHKDQIDVLRAHIDPRQFITANFMGFFGGFDHYELSTLLSFASWDDYVGSGHVDRYSNGLTHDLTRGFKRENFWVMETQPGMVNWSPLNNFLNKGEVRAMAWQAIAHGSDGVAYWQWRGALNGQEQIHGSLLGADGTPLPVYAEIQQLGKEFAKVQEAFRGTRPISQVALLNDYDSRWALDLQRHTQKYDYVNVLRSYYQALRPLTQSLDVISPDAPLDSYQLVVAPSLYLIPEARARQLLEFARNGGHLVLGPRAGMKDEFSALLPQRQPGFLVDALGGRVEQFYALEKDFPISGAWGSGESTIWAEQLGKQSPETQVLMKYGKSNGWLDEQPAVLTRAYGKGRITYIGALLDEELMTAAAQWMVKESGVAPVFGPVPSDIEVSRRMGAGKQVFVLINFAQEARTVPLPRTMKLLISDKESNRVELPPYGVEVLAEK
ncbi:MAG: beta-galactosidase [Acidobacteria bacterium]|nr:beta-galactosidase [Acidobacteriota bacterium]